MSRMCLLWPAPGQPRIGNLAAFDVNAHIVAKFVYCYDGCNAGPGIALMEQQHWTLMYLNWVASTFCHHSQYHHYNNEYYIVRHQSRHFKVHLLSGILAIKIVTIKNPLFTLPFYELCWAVRCSLWGTSQILINLNGFIPYIYWQVDYLHIISGQQFAAIV